MNRYLVHWAFSNGDVDYDSPCIILAETALKAADKLMGQFHMYEVTQVDLLTSEEGPWSRFVAVDGGWILKEGE